MLSLDDPRWATLPGGYRRPCDVRPLLRGVESQSDVSPVWKQLWDALYHQGDVGEASYAAVPHLVRIHRERELLDWNTYALVAAVEVAREAKGNPALPNWLESGYSEAIAQLGEAALTDHPCLHDASTIRAVLALIALWKGARTYGRILIECTEDEVLEMESQLRGRAE